MKFTTKKLFLKVLDFFIMAQIALYIISEHDQRVAHGFLFLLAMIAYLMVEAIPPKQPPGNAVTNVMTVRLDADAGDFIKQMEVAERAAKSVARAVNRAAPHVHKMGQWINLDTTNPDVRARFCTELNCGHSEREAF